VLGSIHHTAAAQLSRTVRKEFSAAFTEPLFLSFPPPLVTAVNTKQAAPSAGGSGSRVAAARVSQEV